MSACIFHRIWKWNECLHIWDVWLDPKFPSFWQESNSRQVRICLLCRQVFARRPWTTGWNNFIIHQRFLKVMLNIIYLYIRWICPPVFFLNVKHRHKFIIGEIISDSSMLQVSLIDIFDRFFSDSSNAADIFEPFEDHSLSAPTSCPLRSNIAVIQLTFHVCISHRTLFHILTLNPVGIPTV